MVNDRSLPFVFKLNFTPMKEQYIQERNTPPHKPNQIVFLTDKKVVVIKAAKLICDYM
jgi:hypothetical protein